MNTNEDKPWPFSRHVIRNGRDVREAVTFHAYVEHFSGGSYTNDGALEYARNYMRDCVQFGFPNGLFTIPVDIVKATCRAMNSVLAIYQSNSDKEEFIKAAKIALEYTDDIKAAELPDNLVD